MYKMKHALPEVQFQNDFLGHFLVNVAIAGESHSGKKIPWTEKSVRVRFPSRHTNGNTTHHGAGFGHRASLQKKAPPRAGKGFRSYQLGVISQRMPYQRVAQ